MKKKNLEPNERNIRRLTIARRREIERLRRDGLIAAETKWQARVLCDLVRIGIAVAHGEGENPIYSLSAAWQEVDITQGIPSRIKLAPPATFQPKEKAGDPAQRKNNHDRYEKPDPPKAKFQRPPAVYSNRSWEQIIDEILKRKI